MRGARLTEGPKERELVLVVTRREFDVLYDALETAARAAPRSASFKRCIKALDALGIW
jgi:hypothetical protein